MSGGPGIYFDIGKKAKDVLHNDYAHQSPIHFHYQFMDWNLDLSCKVDEIVPGFRSIFKCTIPDSGKVELQYLNKFIGMTGCIGLVGNTEGGYDPVVSCSGLIGTRILSLGANVALDIPTRSISKLNAGFSFNSAFLVASLTLHDMFDTLKATCYHEVNPLTKTAIAAEVKHSLSLNETGVTIGAQHAFFSTNIGKG
ncbi:Porin domain superfamily [Sesbania bispinosa]|nr:Porin domain superfamily [Sesbania bispinosa]